MGFLKALVASLLVWLYISRAKSQKPVINGFAHGGKLEGRASFTRHSSFRILCRHLARARVSVVFGR